MSVPDADLVRQAQQGDLDAYTGLVQRYREGMQRYALHLLGNREEAEEALQATFIRAFRAVRQCEQPDRFRAWLTRILVNRCRTRLTRSEPAVGNGEREHALAKASVPPGAESAAWGEEIDRALGALAIEQREAFLLRHVEEFS